MFSCIFLLSCKNANTPPAVAKIKNLFEENQNDINIVVDFMVKSGYESIHITNASSTFWADFQDYTFEDTDVIKSVNRLIENKLFRGIYKEKNTIYLWQWQGISDISCGLALSINKTDLPEIYALTELVPLEANGWYYYVADYELWRTNKTAEST